MGGRVREGGVRSPSARRREPADSFFGSFLVSFFGAFLVSFSGPFWCPFSDPKWHPKGFKKRTKISTQKWTQNGSPDGPKMDPGRHQKIHGNSMPFRGPPRGPKSFQNHSKTMVFQGFGGWFLGRFWGLFWDPKAARKYMQIPCDFCLDFWFKKGPKMEPKMAPKMHGKIHGKSDRKSIQK